MVSEQEESARSKNARKNQAELLLGAGAGRGVI